MRNRYARYKIFGIDDALLGAGLSAASGLVTNMMTGNRQEDQQQFNLMSQGLAQQYNAGEANTARAFNREESHLSRAFNREEAESQRRWAEGMSNSAYQRTMADMQKAGMNPILAYRQGAGSVPSGSSASSGAGPGSPSPTVSPASSTALPYQDVIGPAISSATALGRLANETKLTEAQIRKLEAETGTEQERPEYVRRQTDTERRRPTQVEADTALSGARYDTEKHETRVRKEAGDRADIASRVWETGAGQILYRTGLIGEHSAKAIKPVTDLVRTFKDRWP